MGAQVSLQDTDLISSEYIPRKGIAESYGSSTFSFWKNLHAVFHNGCTSLHFQQHFKGFLFSTSSPTLVSFFFLFFDYSHSNRCEVISHCGFDLPFPDD